MSHTTPLRTAAKPLHERSFAAILRHFGYVLFSSDKYREYFCGDRSHAVVLLLTNRCMLTGVDPHSYVAYYDDVDSERRRLVEALQRRFPEVVV